MLSSSIDNLAKMAGVTWFDYQVEVLEAEQATDAASLRACLYYRTGAGKSLTALALVAQAGAREAVVIAPPSTHDTWVAAGQRLNVEVQAMSHAKFRQKTTKLAKHTAVIADEFHLFGGHGGMGWKKLDRLAAGLQAPLILASATPNYNDAERVYCIQHILDPHSCKGGYIEFVYQHCETEQNPFGRMPIVKGFKNHKDAAEYLSKLDKVYYLPDEVVYTIDDIDIFVPVPHEFDEFGIDRRRRRIIASQIEERHARINHQLTTEQGLMQPAAMREIHKILKAGKPTLIFATHATVAEALSKTLKVEGYNHEIVTGALSTKEKARIISDFRDGKFSWLIGTATLGTGTDGLDKVCDTLLILDDTDDDAARRQLIGRIMPRGADADATKKKVHRLVLS